MEEVSSPFSRGGVEMGGGVDRYRGVSRGWHLCNGLV